jgi:hypothetical protein
VLDLVDNAGPPGSVSFVCDPWSEPIQADQTLPLLDKASGKRNGVEIILYYKASLEESSFDPGNFVVTVGGQPAPGGMKVDRESVKRKDLYRIDVKLTWDQELRHDNVHVSWKNVKPESESPRPVETDLPFKAESSNVKQNL